MTDDNLYSLDDKNNPGAYRVMLGVGPLAVAKLVDPDGVGPITGQARAIVDKIIDAATPAEVADMARAAIDLLARHRAENIDAL